MLRPLLDRLLSESTRRALRYALYPDEAEVVRRLLPRGDARDQIMIDVGAHIGTSLRAFAEDGFTVFAFEPDPENRRRLEATCAGYDAVVVDPRAVSERGGERMPFYRSPGLSGISSLSDFHPTHERVGDVETVSLDAFAKQHGIEHLDFLKIDAEGHDLQVLRGVPWERLRPRFVVCEFEDRKTRPLGWTFHDAAQLLTDRGYRVLVSEWYPIVEYGGHPRWRRFVPYPCELEDPLDWGNLIAAAEGPDFVALHDRCAGLATGWRLGSALRAALRI